MAYSTQTDVQHAAGGAERLLQLSDWDRDGLSDAAAIAQKIAEADAWINSYVGQKRSVPVASPPDILRLCSAREAVFLMKVDRGMATDDDRVGHSERERWLEGVAAGKISLGVEPAPAPSSANGAEYGERESVDGADTREDYEGFV